ncbi:MAG: T9SS type A sorting domain-containing protein, partial [Lewinella sp.]|nr:T9SS type A sorting domain-containing protein [Lewinella sp.]
CDGLIDALDAVAATATNGTQVSVTPDPGNDRYLIDVSWAPGVASEVQLTGQDAAGNDVLLTLRANVLPDLIDPIWQVADEFAVMLADNNPFTIPGTTKNLGGLLPNAGPCNHSMQLTMTGFDLCDGNINAADAVSATATDGTVVTITPDPGDSRYIIDIVWGPGTPAVVTLTGQDAAGNEVDLTLSAEVIDEEPPVITTCQDFTVEFNGEDELPIDPYDIIVDASDNCQIVDAFVDLPLISCAEVGTMVPVTATVVDQGGLTASCTRQVIVGGLPCGWMTFDDHIDCPGSSADFEGSTETFLVTSADCSHSPYSPFSEEYAYVKTELCGDGEIIAQVTDLDGLGKAWAGIVMRENNDPGSKKFQVMTGLDYLQHRVDWRSSTGSTNQTQNFSRYGQHWLRIVRTGNIFRAYTSYNGTNWSVPVNTQIIPMNECLEVGLIVTNVPYATNVTASFNHVFVSGGTPVRPAAPAGHNVAAGQLQVFPNPTTGQLTVNLSAFLEQEATLDVLDLNGQVILQQRLGVIAHSTERLDLSSYAAGLYFVRVRTGDGTTAVQRVVLQPRP